MNNHGPSRLAVKPGGAADLADPSQSEKKSKPGAC